MSLQHAQSDTPANLEAPTASTQPDTPGSLRAVFGLRDFRLLWLGEAISLIGDQFYLIALPWLALRLTGDAFTMGTVLAVEGIPRAVFMLVGGALTDRWTPRAVMLASNLGRMALVALLAAVVLGGAIQVWMIYLFALIFGLMDAFFYPAQTSIVPRLVEEAHLQTANAITMMTQQFSLFGGPVLAGALIALFSQGQDTGPAADLTGIGAAFGVDALTFLVSAWTLWLIRPQRRTAEPDAEDENLLAAIRQGLVYVRHSPTLRSVFTLIVFANVLVVAPITVGIPVLADTRLPQGAAAFGIIMSAFGGGNLIGMGLAGALPRPSDRRLGLVISLVWSTMGISTALLGLATTTLTAALIGAGMGAANGYVVIVFITWLQSATPEAMLGRMMGLFLFSTVGLAPVAHALMGAVVGWNLTASFAGAGLLMTVIVLGSVAVNPALRVMQRPPASVPA